MLFKLALRVWFFWGKFFEGLRTDVVKEVGDGGNEKRVGGGGDRCSGLNSLPDAAAAIVPAFSLPGPFLPCGFAWIGVPGRMEDAGEGGFCLS
jgi:hypothetical protein